MSTFELLPAIDLLGGRVVRLRQEDFSQATAYGSDPASVASAFVASGATWLHVVDLDGARVGEPQQLQPIAEVVAEVMGRAHGEVGGGLRTAAAVAGALAAGSGPRVRAKARQARSIGAADSAASESMAVTLSLLNTVHLG